MSLVFPAAANNAHWCDLMCRLHGAAGQFTEVSWSCSAEVPPLYPNYVAMVPDVDDQHLRLIGDVVRKAGDWGIAVKDSFDALDLTGLGFIPLFDAEWLAMPPGNKTSIDTGNWQVIDNRRALANWETCWREADGFDGELPSPLFRPDLVDNKNTCVVGRVRHGKFESGAIAYEACGVLGVSNFFSPPAARLRDFTACLAFLRQLRPALTVVGYEEPGFALELNIPSLVATGPLRVWFRERA